MVIQDVMYGYQMIVCEIKLQAMEALLTKAVMHHDGIHHCSDIHLLLSFLFAQGA